MGMHVYVLYLPPEEKQLKHLILVLHFFFLELTVIFALGQITLQFLQTVES